MLHQRGWAHGSPRLARFRLFCAGYRLPFGECGLLAILLQRLARQRNCWNCLRSLPAIARPSAAIGPFSRLSLGLNRQRSCVSVLLNRFQLFRCLSVPCLFANATQAPPASSSTTPSTSSLLELLLTLAALVRRLPLSFGSRAAGGLTRLRDRRPLWTFQAAVCTATPGTARAIALFATARLLNLCKFLGVLLLLQKICDIQKGVALQP